MEIEEHIGSVCARVWDAHSLTPRNSLEKFEGEVPYGCSGKELSKMGCGPSANENPQAAQTRHVPVHTHEATENDFEKREEVSGYR